MTTRRLSLAILGAVMLQGGTAAAQPARPAIVEDRAETAAVVESVDLQARTVLLRGPEGRLLTVLAGPEVRNLPQLRAGDRVAVRYYRGVAVRMTPPGAAAPSPRLETAGVQAAPGARPGIGAAERILTRVRIEAVDTTAWTVSFTDADGTSHSVALREPALREFARGLKGGDEVDVEMVEALAVSVEPAPP